MSTRYKTSGDKFEANCLFPEGRHHLSILKNMMNFQGIDQQQRSIVYEDGTVIKCASCFGQDVIDIFVPPGRAEEEPEYVERLEQKYLPAFEVYDGPTPDSIYMGIVLCRGGGFNPPYKFFPKESLPEDTADTPLEKLPKERIWYPYENAGIETVASSLRLEDIVPKGIAVVDLVNSVPVVAEEDWTEKVGEWVGNACCIHDVERPFCYPRFGEFPGVWEASWCFGNWLPNFEHSRTEHLKKDIAFSYTPKDDTDPGYWPSYTYEGTSHSGGRRPCRSLNLKDFPEGFYYEINGSGDNQLILDTRLSGTNLPGWESCPGQWGSQPASTSAGEVLAFMPTSHPYEHFEFPKRYHFCEVSDVAPHTRFRVTYVHYSWIIDQYLPFIVSGSVMDSDHHALVYSLQTGREKTGYYKPPIGGAAPKCIPVWPCDLITDKIEDPPVVRCDTLTSDFKIKTSTFAEGPLSIVIDGIILELFPQGSGDTAPRLQMGNVKYFSAGEEEEEEASDKGRGIGLFSIAKNYNYPFDYMYVWAEAKSPEGGGEKEGKSIITLVENKYLVGDGLYAHEIPDVTDKDGNVFYGRWGFRLIREEEMIKEEV